MMHAHHGIKMTLDVCLMHIILLQNNVDFFIFSVKNIFSLLYLFLFTLLIFYHDPSTSIDMKNALDLKHLHPITASNTLFSIYNGIS